MVQVTPVWASLEVLAPMQVQQLPQKLAGGGSMIFPYFDVIPKAKCQITITYPESIKLRNY